MISVCVCVGGGGWGGGAQDTNIRSEEGGERKESQRAKELDSNSLYKLILTLHKAPLCEKNISA